MSLPTRTLGSLTVSSVGLGCMGMSFAYEGAPEERSLATIDRAFERGITFLDTADVSTRHQDRRQFDVSGRG